ncbi:hypothetical protein COCNU_07G010160 [Cocos nucifera]|uniref:Uncharacterized protein n=1 Tax=Cocos nucifera TaxID=13894 RepID=A0A8K0N5M4_COCNU|nr:hypothetical protein COCNU_07G010160 [Cocos nucifera]
MGSVACKLKRFDNSLELLNAADEILGRLEFESCSDSEVRSVNIIVQLQLARAAPRGSITASMGLLLHMMKRVPQAVPYLENATEKLNSCVTPKHVGLGFVCKHLPQAYLEMDQLLAVKMPELAKYIIDFSFRPYHEDVIDTCQCLSNAYGAIERFMVDLEVSSYVKFSCPKGDQFANLLDLFLNYRGKPVAIRKFQVFIHQCGS